jgi:hypothetical protein
VSVDRAPKLSMLAATYLRLPLGRSSRSVVHSPSSQFSARSIG